MFCGALDGRNFGIIERVMRALPAGRALLTEGEFRDWNDIAVPTIVTNAGKPPAVASIDLVYVNVTIYDAVNTLEGGNSVFAVSTGNPTAGA